MLLFNQDFGDWKINSNELPVAIDDEKVAIELSLMNTSTSSMDTGSFVVTFDNRGMVKRAHLENKDGEVLNEVKEHYSLAQVCMGPYHGGDCLNLRDCFAEDLVATVSGPTIMTGASLMFAKKSRQFSGAIDQLIIITQDAGIQEWKPYQIGSGILKLSRHYSNRGIIDFDLMQKEIKSGYAPSDLNLWHVHGGGLYGEKSVELYASSEEDAIMRFLEGAVMNPDRRNGEDIDIFMVEDLLLLSQGHIRSSELILDVKKVSQKEQKELSSLQV